MTKITVELTEDEDMLLRHIIVDRKVPSKAMYIEQVMREHLAQQQSIKYKIEA